MLKAFIVEDEAPAARRLQRMLEETGAVEVTGMAHSYNEALRALNETKADVVFLDIELGDGTGFDVLQNLDAQPRFEVIFCTAYDEFALQAFEVAAIDYLLKPVSPERLEKALARVSRETRKPEPLRRLFVEHRKSLVVLAVENIDCFESERNYLIIRSGGEEYVMRGTVQSLLGRLDPGEFVQASRRSILRLDAVERIENEMTAVLKSGHRIQCTRKFWITS